MPTGTSTSTRNWLGKATLLAGATLSLLACQEPSEIGLAPTTPVGVFFSDTFSVERSTVLLDSVQSNGLSGLLTGRYTDPIFGKGQAASFARLELSTAFTVVDKDKKVVPTAQIVYDSTRLVMSLQRESGFSYFYGDTLVPQQLSVHRLTEDIGTANYDIRNRIGYETQPLARFTVRPRPRTTTGDTALIARLPDAIGQDLIKLANTAEGSDATKFLALNKKGLAVVTSTDRASLLQLSRFSYIAVYYHVQGDTTASSYGFFLSGNRFTNLTVDRAGTPLASLRAGQALPSSATNGRTFVQPMTGVTTRLTFPSLLSIEENRRVGINRADLVITPTQPDGTFPGGGLPPYIALAEANGFQIARSSPNRLVQLVPVFPGVAVNTTESSFYSPQVVAYNSRTRDYTINMTGYIQAILAGKRPNNGLYLLTPISSDIGPVTTQGLLQPSRQQIYLNDRVQRMLLDGKASAKLVLFFTSSN